MDTKIISLNTEVDQELKEKFKKAKAQSGNFESYLREFLASFISKQTQRAYLRDLWDFFHFLARADQKVTHPRDINSVQFSIYRDELTNNQLSSATINRKLVAIRSFIKWSIANKLIDHNPLDAIKLPKVQTKTPTVAFDDDEVLKMISAPIAHTPKGAMHRLLMIMLFSLGLRRSELSGIKLKDLYQDRGHNVLKITGKGSKDRHLPLSDNLIDEIKTYLDILKENSIKLEKEDYLFQTLKGKIKNQKPINGSTIYRIIQKYADQCNINKKVSPHSCRATVISHLLDTHQTPIRDVAIFAGHENITTTERYDKRRKGLDQSAAYQVNYKKNA